MKKNFLLLITLIVLSSMIMTACAPKAAEPAKPAVAEPTKAEEKEEPAKVEEPTKAPEPTAVEEKVKEVEPTKESTGGSNKVAQASEDTELKVSGLVANEKVWTAADINALEVVSAESTNKEGVTETYNGVLLSVILTMAEPSADATIVAIVADDGYTAEVSLADLLICNDCILSFRTKGGLSSVLPGFDKKAQVKGVVEIQVK